MQVYALTLGGCWAVVVTVIFMEAKMLEVLAVQNSEARIKLQSVAGGQTISICVAAQWNADNSITTSCQAGSSRCLFQPPPA